jgi:hypothetical protein
MPCLEDIYTAHLATLFGMSFLNIASCFACTASFASSISGRSSSVLSSRCSAPLCTTVKSGMRALGGMTDAGDIVQYCSTLTPGQPAQHARLPSQPHTPSPTPPQPPPPCPRPPRPPQQPHSTPPQHSSPTPSPHCVATHCSAPTPCCSADSPHPAPRPCPRPPWRARTRPRPRRAPPAPVRC